MTATTEDPPPSRSTGIPMERSRSSLGAAIPAAIEQFYRNNENVIAKFVPRD
jgi:hypothetical protein